MTGERSYPVTAEQLAVLVRYLESQSDRLTRALDNPGWTPRRSHTEGDRNAFLAAANTLEQALRSGVAQASRKDALRLLSDLFSESVHETWSKEEIVNIIEDAIRVGSPLPSTLRQCPICARRVASPCETLAIATSCPLSSTDRGTGK